MDRNEALRLLKGGSEGVAEWNRWRKAGDEIPDLSRADLREADLSGANLSRANLSESKDLTQWQVEFATGDDKTKLPQGIIRPKHWTKAPTK